MTDFKLNFLVLFNSEFELFWAWIYSQLMGQSLLYPEAQKSFLDGAFEAFSRYSFLYSHGVAIFSSRN
jgi:hypothetical protein